MPLQFPRPFRAYLFDCDGTIVDSMPLHYIAWKQALGEWGCTFDEDLFYSWGGKPPVEIIADLNQMRDLNMPVEAVAERKESLYFRFSTTQARSRGPRAHRRPARPHSLCRRLRQHPRIIVKSLTTVGLLDASHPRRLRRLRALQARSRRIPHRRRPPRRRAQRLPRL
jgi:hypothetical protein